MKPDVKLSIIITSYNHEKYISQAIDSVINQQVQFNIEIVIGDDYSHDKSRAIIENYAKKHPSLIKQYFPNQNIGVHNLFSKLISISKGKYLAFLDGDDYWISSIKLSKQIDFLEKNSLCNLVFHNAIVKYEGLSDLHSWKLNQLTNDCYLNTREIIAFRSIQTSTMVMRRSILGALPDNDLISWHKMEDWTLSLFVSLHGAVAYMSEPMSVYRQHADSEWSSIARGKMTEIFINRYELVRPYLSDQLHNAIDFEIVQVLNESILNYEKSRNFAKATELLNNKTYLLNQNTIGQIFKKSQIRNIELTRELTLRFLLVRQPLIYKIFITCIPIYQSIKYFSMSFYRFIFRIFILIRYRIICIIYACPNPAPTTLPSGLGITLLRWISSKPLEVQIRIGSPTGALFHQAFGMTGSSVTGKWVANNSLFFLMDASKSPGWNGVLDFIYVNVSEQAADDLYLNSLLTLEKNYSSVSILNQFQLCKSLPAKNLMQQFIRLIKMKFK
ncbi:MAG: glycosyltransferase [Limnohabitans sp.]